MRPSRGIWRAWTLVVVGGLAVLVAAVLVINDPCARAVHCSSSTVTGATALALVGTVLAVGGGLLATYLTVRR